jgi:ketosteroid isomerase-like protein
MTTSEAHIRAMVDRWIGPAEDGKGVMNISPGALEMLTEDAVWIMPPSNPLGEIRGRDNIVKIHSMARKVYQWDTLKLRPIKTLVDGDEAVAYYEISCLQVLDGEPYQCQYAHFLTFRDGLIAEIRDLFDSLHWYRQSGHKLEAAP